MKRWLGSSHLLVDRQQGSFAPDEVKKLNRRDLLILGGTAIAWPLAAHAEQKAISAIGYLNGTTGVANEAFVTAFRRGLAETGYVEGQNLTIEYRWAEFHYDRLPGLAADLVSRNVELIAACGGAGEAEAAKGATTSTPIVFTTGSDPVASGLVASLARPGGNLTGITNLNVQLWQKRVELISELVPQARRIGLLGNPNAPRERAIASVQEAARAKGFQVQILDAATDGEIDAAFASLTGLHIDALIVGEPLFDSRSEQIVALASRRAVPTVYIARKYVAEGGLISYGAIFADAYHQAGLYAGKILRGTRPADLPVQQSTKFELVINMRTAKALGLTIPQSLLARADEVIE